MSKIRVEKYESKALELSDFNDLEIEVLEGANFDLKLINFESLKNIKMSAKIGLNATFNVIFAEFSNDSIDIKSVVDLTAPGAACYWKLATLGNGSSKKTFDISFIHNEKETTAEMNNYGVACGESNIIFTGVNHIKNGCTKSVTRQNAKVIVFDEKANGTASPILKIDENDVVASHGAVVGQLNEDHMFYLMSRGLNKNEARKIITMGYLKPISNYFSEDTQNKIQEKIMEVV